MSRRNPLASYRVTDRKLRGEYSQSQWYLFSRVAPEVFERVFRRWPLPVRIRLAPPERGAGSRPQSLARSMLFEHPDSCNIIVRHMPWEPVSERPERFATWRESLYTPFTMMHRIYDETYFLPVDRSGPGGKFRGPPELAFFISPDLRKLSELTDSEYAVFTAREQRHQIEADLLDSYKSRWMQFRRGKYYAPPISDITGLGIDTETGRNSVMDHDQAEADVFAKWILYRRWAYQSEPPYRLTAGQKRFVHSVFAEEGLGDPDLFIQAAEQMIQSPAYIEYRRQHAKYLKKRMGLLAKVLQNHPFTIVI